MQVNLYAIFRLHAGVKTFNLDLLPGTNVYQAVLHIVSQYPALRKDWLDENDCLQTHVHIFIDGSEVGALPQGLDTPLQPANVLDFFPPIAGGRDFTAETQS
jgi:molybdopterin converting factor small subunit